jgi:Outer membrane protein beta-barrel domain
MKKLLITLIAVLAAIPAFSQLKFGIKAGVSSTTITMDEIKQVTYGTTAYSIEKLEGMNFGFHGGIFGRVTITKLFVQPEILFSTRTNEYKVTDVLTSNAKDVKQSFNKIDVPVMVGIKLGPARIDAGPVGSFLINSPADLIDNPNFETIYSKMSFGYQAGVGADLLGKLTIDLRYEGSLKKYQNQIQNAAGTSFNLDDRPNAFLLSIGIMF